MKTYHKINTIFKRDMANKGKMIMGNFAIPEIEYLKDNKWVFTEKVDGTNIRVMWNGKEIKYGGKTDNASIPVFLYDKLNSIFSDKFEKFNSLFVPTDEDENVEVCLYGEGYGARIQGGGGKYIKDGVDFVLFDIKIGHLWLKREDIEDIAKKLGLKVVPIIGEGIINEMLEMAKKGFKSQWGDFLAEGIVAKPKIELKDRRSHRIITKIKYVDFQ